MANLYPPTTTEYTIVLDLDETLLHTMPDKTSALENTILTNPQYIETRGRHYHITLNDFRTAKGSGTRDDYWGVKRPHLNLFLGFCFSYFKHVVIWSAGQKPYVHGVTNAIFDDVGVPDIIYSYDECAKIPVTDDYHKPLSKLISDPNIPGLKPEQIFFIDDRPENFLEYQTNAIIIPKYRPYTSTAMASDDYALLQLRQWFMLPNVINSTDVRLLPKSDIFTRSLIDNSDLKISNVFSQTVPIYNMNPLFGVVTSPLNLDRYYESFFAPVSVMG